MAEDVKGRWVTVRGAHVFIKDGETPSFNRKLQKSVKKENQHGTVNEEKERMELAKQISKEVYGSEKYVEDVLGFPDDYVFDDDEETYQGKNGIEKSTKELKDWLKELKGTQDDDFAKMAEKSKMKVKATREFIEKTVKEINDSNKKPYDPYSADYGMTNSDLQGLVEAFGTQWGFDLDDEERVLDEIRTRTNMSGGSQQLKSKYEENAKANNAYWKLQKYNAHPMKTNR